MRGGLFSSTDKLIANARSPDVQIVVLGNSDPGKSCTVAVLLLMTKWMGGGGGSQHELYWGVLVSVHGTARCLGGNT